MEAVVILIISTMILDLFLFVRYLVVMKLHSNLTTLVLEGKKHIDCLKFQLRKFELTFDPTNWWRWTVKSTVPKRIWNKVQRST